MTRYTIDAECTPVCAVTSVRLFTQTVSVTFCRDGESVALWVTPTIDGVSLSAAEAWARQWLIEHEEDALRLAYELDEETKVEAAYYAAEVRADQDRIFGRVA